MTKKYSEQEITEAKHARTVLLADRQWTDAFYGRAGSEAQRLAQREWSAWGEVINGHLKAVEE